MGTNLKKGISFVIIAVVLFAVSCIDRIELIGQYRVVEIEGQSVEKELARSMGINVDDPGKFYMTFGAFGGVSGKYKMSSELKDKLESMGVDKDEIKEAEEQVSKGFADGDMEWSVKDGKIVMGDEDDEGVDYKLGLFELTILDDDGEVEGELKRAGITGYLCPSILMKVASIILLLVGITNILKKDDDYYYDDGYVAGYTGGETVDYSSGNTCPNCGGVLDPADAFCQNCGSPVDGVAPATPVASAPEVAHCVNCGGVLDPADAFCQNCGSPVDGVAPATPVASAPEVAHCVNCGGVLDPADAFCQNCGSPVGGAAPVTPATPAPEILCCANCGGELDPADAFCQNCGSPVGGGVAPVTPVTPAPEVASAPTPAPEVAPKKGGLTSTFRPAPAEPVEEDEHFTPAGDL